MPAAYTIDNLALAVIRRLAGDHRAVADAPQSFEALLAATGGNPSAEIPVWNGASESSIYGSDRGNFAFRAWHDRLHVILHAGFDAEGERAVAVAQRDAILRATGDSEAAEAVWADVWGQFLYERRHGRFPDDQAAFVKTWLERGEAAALEGVF